MSIKFEKIKEEMILYDVRKNTTGFPIGSRWSVWPVYIKEIDVENKRVFASWNGNKPIWISEN